MDNLTVIIPFLNEGEEVFNTIDNIRETSSKNVNIIMIDDCSNDNYNYKYIADLFSAEYYRNNKRMGVAYSRDLGIRMCKTEYFILLDAHMRFYTQFWDKKIIISLLDPKSLVCCQTKRLKIDSNGSLVENNSQITTYGAHIGFNYLSLIWNTFDPNPKQMKVEIPCIIGAAYASTRSYWQYLHGLKFLKEIGFDEQYISLKTFLSGGKCYLLKDLISGHIYRDNPPYLINQVNPVYNRLLIAELLLPRYLKEPLYERSEKYMNKEHCSALKMLYGVKNQLIEEKDYLQDLFEKSIEDIVDYNNKFNLFK